MIDRKTAGEARLDGQVAIVTGGTRGIGRVIAMDLVSAGAHVAINFRRSADEAEEFVRQIDTMGRRGIAVQANVASFVDAQKMADTALDPPTRHLVAKLVQCHNKNSLF